MSKLIFDIETNGYLKDLTKIHCIVTRDIEAPHGVFNSYYGDSIGSGVKTLSEANMLICHNQIGFDLLAIEKLYPNFKRPENLIDTLVLSRLAYPDRPGGHSLEAWAKYFISKGKVQVPEKYFIKSWKEQPIEDYLMRCETDVMINEAVWDFLKHQIEQGGM